MVLVEGGSVRLRGDTIIPSLLLGILVWGKTQKLPRIKCYGTMRGQMMQIVRAVGDGGEVAQ